MAKCVNGKPKAGGLIVAVGFALRTLALEYIPTKREIAAKCRLLRTIDGWRGAAKRAPRGGEFAVPTTAGV